MGASEWRLKRYASCALHLGWSLSGKDHMSHIRGAGQNQGKPCNFEYQSLKNAGGFYEGRDITSDTATPQHFECKEGGLQSSKHLNWHPPHWRTLRWQMLNYPALESLENECDGEGNENDRDEILCEKRQGQNREVPDVEWTNYKLFSFRLIIFTILFSVPDCAVPFVEGVTLSKHHFP